MTTLLTVVEDRDYPGYVATEPVVRRLAARLVSRGESVRVLAPPPLTEGWPAEVELVVGDVAQPDEASHAFSGLRRMFLAGAVPDTVYRVVELARFGGVDRITVLSSHGPAFEVRFGPDSWYWLAVEVVVERSGAQWTHLSPAPVMAQTVRLGFPDAQSDVGTAIRAHRTVREADLDSVYPYIDEDDLAAIAVSALLEDGYAGRTLTVHGAPISLREQVRLIGDALGRDIPLERLTPEEIADRARGQGMDEEEIQELLPSGAELDPEGEAADPEFRHWVDQGIDTVSRILGRPPRDYASWVTDNVHLLR